MRSFPLFLVIVIVFILSLSKHLSLIMYPLCAVIFYFYLPLLYTSSRLNILHHQSNADIWHIKFYPIELSMWFISTCFFSYILSHLLSDILFLYRESLYHFTFFLIILGMGGVTYYELDAKKISFH